MQKEYVLIRDRLVGEVGAIIELINSHNADDSKKHVISPFWSLTRMLFPIAESLGDLRYRGKRKSNALPDIMKEYLVRRNSVYGNLSHTITQLFRHSLLHTDEMRSLKTSAGILGWGMTHAGGESFHLSIIETQNGGLLLSFDPSQFYEDLRYLCTTLAKEDIDNDVTSHYESWKIRDLTQYTNTNEEAAAKEIETLYKTRSKSLTEAILLI